MDGYMTGISNYGPRLVQLWRGGKPWRECVIGPSIAKVVVPAGFDALEFTPTGRIGEGGCEVWSCDSSDVERERHQRGLDAIRYTQGDWDGMGRPRVAETSAPRHLQRTTESDAERTSRQLTTGATEDHRFGAARWQAMEE